MEQHRNKRSRPFSGFLTFFIFLTAEIQERNIPMGN